MAFAYSLIAASHLFYRLYSRLFNIGLLCNLLMTILLDCNPVIEAGRPKFNPAHDQHEVVSVHMVNFVVGSSKVLKFPRFWVFSLAHRI